MKEPLRRYIFLIRRRSGDTLLLHPFRAGDDVFRDPERLVLAGRFATEPDAAASESLRALLHEELEKGARADVLDRGFYLRLLVSASVFLVFYLFLSVVIRDPVPLVDEFLVGGLGSAACWLALERRSLSSPVFSARLAALRTSLDSALFQSSRVCRALEESLQDAETLDSGKYAEYLSCSPEFDATEEERRELTAVSSALESRLPTDAVEGIRNCASRQADSDIFIRKMVGKKRMDIPMLLSYARIRALLGVGGE